ncbi:MAG TPA: hypothetical protein VFQ23_11880, partial [Anaerolineales bacterium]|nr:hypothetical protein [Anaerolineales bacterium]
MDTESKIRTSYTTEYVVITGYVLFFCILIFACLGFFYINRSAYFPKPPAANEFAEALPPTTPTPHITSDHQFEKDSILFQEDFNVNQNHWLGGDNDTKERLQGGQLFFQSAYEGNYAIISCESCPYLDTPYYLEASLSTSMATDESYGIIFNRSYTLDDFFLFMINPESMNYSLFHHTQDGWTHRASGASSQIQPYPESTTLGVYANKDSLELYIN